MKKLTNRTKGIHKLFMHILDVKCHQRPPSHLPPPISTSHLHSLRLTKGLRSLDHPVFNVVQEGTARASGRETCTQITATGNNCEKLRTLGIPLKPGMEQTCQLKVLKEGERCRDGGGMKG